MMNDRLGEPVSSQRPDRCKVEYVDARDEPYARFQFRYRPLGEIAPSAKEDVVAYQYANNVWVSS